MRIAEATDAPCSLCREGHYPYLGRPEVKPRQTHMWKLTTYSDLGTPLRDVLYCPICDPNVGAPKRTEAAE